MVLYTFVWKDWRDLFTPAPISRTPLSDRQFLYCNTRYKYKVNGNMGHAVLFPLSYQHAFLPQNLF